VAGIPSCPRCVAPLLIGGQHLCLLPCDDFGCELMLLTAQLVSAPHGHHTDMVVLVLLRLCVVLLLCPAGQDSSATKLSAAAFISRAHAAALAASAQRRGQRTIPSASGGVYGSPAGFNSFGSPAAASSQGGEHSYAGSPGAASSLSAAVAAGGGGSNADADGPQAGVRWPIRRPRASSSGIPEAERQSLEHFSSLPAPQQQLLQSADGGLGSCGSCGKISASEQLRLTHSALRASATGGGGGGLQLAGQHPGGGGSNARHSSTSGGVGGTEAGGIGQLIGTGVEQQALPVKGRVSSHRRFASMSAMQ
jgi:hypothetical protein